MRYWKFILLAALLLLNTVLFLTWKEQRENREKIHFILTNNEPVIAYLAEQPRKIYDLSMILSYKGYPFSIASDADSIQRALHQLQARTVVLDYGGLDTNKYFESTLSVSPDQQEKLWSAAQQYITSLITVVEESIPAEKRKWDSLYVVFKEQLRQKEQRLLSFNLVYDPFTQKARLMAELELPRRLLRIQGYKLKDEDFIRWQSKDLLAYERVLKSKINSPKALQASKQLNKFSSIFVAKGKLMMYGKIVNLSSLTPAELQSVCKYVLVTKARTEDACRDAFYEFNTYF